MKPLFLLLFTLFVQQTFSQADSSIYRIHYKVSYVCDSTKPQSIKSDIMLLDLFEDSSIFFSMDLYEKELLAKQDSALIEQLFATGIVYGKDFAKYESNGQKEILFHNYKLNTITHYMVDMYNFYYTDSISFPQWTLHTDTSVISGMICQKATCTLGGRNYTAWFHTGIAVSKGPWKLHGLPGIIIKAYDHKNHFTYEWLKSEVIEIKYNKFKDYTLPVKSNLKKITKKELFALLKEEYEDISSFNRRMGLSIDVQNPIIKPPRYYNPQEFE